MEEKIDMNCTSTTCNIGFTFNNKTPWFMHAEQIRLLLLDGNINNMRYYHFRE